MNDKLFRPVVNEIKEYKPGKNPEKPGVIKLASNENPFGPSPAAIKAIEKESKSLQMYPDQKSTLLRNALSKKLNIGADYIIAGNGSDDIMQIAGATFVSPGEEIIISKHSFSVYELIAKIFEGKIAVVDLKNYEIDLSGAFSAITDKTKMIFLTNPNNPTGAYISASALESFMAKVPDNILVVVDEAYCEFAEAKDFPDTIRMIREGKDNLLVLRTFSKFYGLAGLRAGYGIAAPALVSAMMKVKMPFNASRLAQKGAEAALDDKAFLEKTFKNNAAGKKQLYEGLEKLGLKYLKTESNYIFINIKNSADEVFLKMMSEGIIIRPLTSFGFPEAIRASIGTQDQNKKFLDALRIVLG